MNEDLKNRVVSGHFQKLLAAMLTPLYEYYAKEINHAINTGNGLVLIEIMCQASNSEIKKMNKNYQKSKVFIFYKIIHYLINKNKGF